MIRKTELLEDIESINNDLTWVYNKIEHLEEELNKLKVSKQPRDKSGKFTKK